MEAIRSDGTVFPIEMNITETLKTEDSHYFTAVVKDITDRKLIEAQLKKSKAELELLVEQRTRSLQKINHDLERSNEELERFAYIASHDLQEPLRTISGFIKLLDKRLDNHGDPVIDEFMKFINKGTDRMHNLIQDLLSYSRTGTQELDAHPHELSSVLYDVCLLLGQKIKDKKAIIEFNEEMPEIFGDKILLVRLFQNLIDNSIKFCTQQPVIKIWVEEGEEKNLIYLSDNGIGIEEEHREDIFTIFQRLHNREEFSGTGIGLSICKKIMNRHGGDIEILPNTKEGTTFMMTFPNKFIEESKEKEE